VSAVSEPRTLAPPARRIARVTENEAVGAYRLISAHDALGPVDPRPGQFYMLAAAERWGGGDGERPYLPRAFSYARARPLESGVELSFLLDAVGPGTGRLAELRGGDGLALVGPLGVGFRLPAATDGVPTVVGGGIGAAPLLCLSEALLAELGGERLEVLLGFRSGAHAEAARLFPGQVRLATDDGSVGRHALVTELLRETLDGDPRTTVLACGPPPMLEAVRALCTEREVAGQLALESGMACGFGACFGCVAPTTGGYLRLCVDGPVLDAADLESTLFPGAGH
jgi:dihydroorotate dehydrogenase electron transfer subunit